MSTDHTRIRIDGARTILEPGALVPRLTAAGEISLVASRALLLGGDELRLTIEVGSGSRLMLRDIAAMVAYDGKGDHARYDLTITLEDDAVLVWDAQPLIVSDGADVRRTLRAECGSGSRLLVRDTLVLGRSSQSGGRLDCRTRIAYAGMPAVAEDLHLPDAGPGVIGCHRVIDTATAIGWRPTSTHAARFDLDAPGVVERDLQVRSDRSAVGRSWAAWCADLTRARPISAKP